MKILIISSIFLIFQFVLFPVRTNAQDVEKTVVADCFVRTGSGVQTQDYHLLKHSGATDRRPYLRFDISGIDTTRIKSVHVAMYLSGAFTNPNSMDLKFYKVPDNSWDETTQTWPGPAYDPAPCADFTIDSIVGWKKSSDMTSYLKERYKEPDKLLSLALFSEQTYNSTLNFHSKETAGGNAPVLQVYYEEADTIVVYDTVTVYDTVKVYDTVTVYDTIWINDTTFHDVYDTTHVVINDTVWYNDTVQVYETIYHTIYDTAHVVVYDTVTHVINDTVIHIVNDTVIHTVNDTIWYECYKDTVQVYINDTIWHTVNDTNKITINDTIWVTVNDTNIVSIFDTIKVSVEDTLNINIAVTGLNPPDNIAEILVYPNPTRGILNIKCDGYSNLTGYSIKLIDALSSVKWASDITSDLFTIDLTNFSSGVYFLEIYNKQNIKIETKHIILH